VAVSVCQFLVMCMYVHAVHIFTDHGTDVQIEIQEHPHKYKYKPENVFSSDFRILIYGLRTFVLFF
jgi:hypothetical protein